MSAAQLVYDHVPAEVTRVSAYSWQPGTAPVALAVSVRREAGQIVLALTASGTAIVLMQREDDGYLIDGPLMLHDAVAERAIDPTWRHTIGGAADPSSKARPSLDWLAAGVSTGGAWPACWWGDVQRWQCMGVPLDASGVIVGLDGTGVVSAIASGGSTPVLRASAWGRVMNVGDRAAGPPPGIRLSVARPVSPPQRSQALRLETTALADVRVIRVAPGVYWISGDSSPPDAWLEVRSARSGPQYLPLVDVAGGSPQLPLQIIMDDRRDLVVSALSDRGEPAGGALVTVFRVIDSMTPPGARDQPPRRVLAGEATAGADGMATIEALGEADYEIVTWHPQLGRASVRLPPGETHLTIHLHSPGIARGRVVMNGKPVPGVDVIGVPDAAAYFRAADPIDLKGGDARTANDGRFWIALAPGGGGELRVGGGAYPIVRVPLPRGGLPLVELGDIELGHPLTIGVTLDQDPGCDLRATGPVGRSGLQIVAAVRTGLGLFRLTLPEEGSWEVVLLCGRSERALAPAIVQVSARDGPRDVRLTVR